MPSPVDAADLRERVHKRLEIFIGDRMDLIAEVDPDCQELAGSIRDLLRGGKRLRAAFCYWGWRGAGGADGEEIIDAAAAMEMLQAAALIHDDVMDDSDTRRGMPAVHRRFALLHRQQGWAGDTDRFGEAGAILAGDLALVWCDELFSGCGLGVEAIRRGRVPFDRMRTQLMAGQYLDMLEQAMAPSVVSGDGDPARRARQVIRFKAAKYSIEEPLQIGGALAGADEALLAGYRAYGLPLGEAFQLRDDVLGVFGDPRQTGKPAGDDLREGKRTVLVARTLAGATAQQAEQVNALLGDPELSAEQIDHLRSIIIETGALSAVEELITERTEACRRALATLPDLGVVPEAQAVLTDLVDAATSRST